MARDSQPTEPDAEGLRTAKLPPPPPPSKAQVIKKLTELYRQRARLDGQIEVWERMLEE